MRARRLDAWLAAAGARLETAAYPRAGGRARGCRLVPAGEVRARVVLAHGAGNDALYPLLALCRPLLASGVEIFAFDLDGHGRESTTVFGDEVESALADALHHAEAGRAPLPLHLLGHSLGGSLVLHALAQPGWERVASAAVLSAPVRLDVGVRAALGEVRGFFGRATLAQREHYGVWGIVPAVGPLKRGAYPFRVESGRGFGYVAAVQALLARLRIEEASTRIRTPTLLVYSRGDRLVPLEQGELLASRIPGARLERLERPSHWGVPFDGRAVERVAAWLGAR